ncbi:PQQ-binding-like beta-propeller repeat protein [bacterium]|nr:PQQ-binding-like beta-propeller repeat protein [bacterium]
MKQLLLLLFLICRAFALQFIHITDTHIGTANGLKNLNSFIQLVQNFPEKPDFVIHTGDVTEFGSEEEFKAYSQAIKSLNVPFYHTLGNHDVRWNGAGWLIGEKYLPNYKRNYTFTNEGITFIALDSSFPFSQYGLMDPSQLAWLKNTLAKIPSEQPIIIFFHHPIMPSRNFLIGKDALLEVLRPYNVVLILTGHGHSNQTWQVDGINFIMTKGLMDANACFRLIKIKNDTIGISTFDLSGNEIQNQKFTFPLKRTQPTPFPTKSNDNFLLKRLSGAIQADLLSYNDLVIACNWAGEVVAIKSKVREEAWRKRFDSPILTSPILNGGKLFVPFLNGFVRCVDANNGKMLWETKLPQPISGHLTFADGKLFVPASQYLFALNEKGEIIWQRKLGGNLESRPLIMGKNLLIGAWDKNLYFLNVENGEIIWQKEQARSRYYSPATSSPLLWNNKLLLTQPYDNSTRKGGLLALDDKGELIWQIDGNFGYSTPVIDGDRLFIASMEGNLYCVSPEGKVLWKTNLANPCFNSRPVIKGEIIYIVSFNNVLFCVDKNSGKILNKKALAKDSCCISTPIIVEESMLIGDMMGNLYFIPLGGLVPA